MRTTLSIDDDVLAAARERARREGRPLGEVISDLARRALLGAGGPVHGPADDLSDGPFRPFPSRGRVISNEIIDALRDQEGGVKALVDVNVLLALFDPDHVDHRTAQRFVRTGLQDGWATCPLTQNGFVRIISQPRYPSPVATADALSRLAEAASHESHTFWPDDASLLDPAVLDRSSMLGPRQVTDAYLLALAVRHGGRLVTFDTSIPIRAVVGATTDHVQVLTDR